MSDDRLELTDHDLVEHLALGRTRATPWSEVRRVRWIEAGHAEVVCGGQHVIELRGEPEEIEALVETIRDTAERTQRRWQTYGVPAALICDWLGIAPGGVWREENRSRARAAAGGWLIACGALLALVVDLVPFAFMALFAGAMLLLASLDRSRSQPLHADGNRLTWPDGRERCTVVWRDLHGVDVRVTTDGPHQTTHLRLRTIDGEYELRGEAGRFGRILEAAQKVVAARHARISVVDVPVPDTALSPARLSDEQAERGLSQSE